MRRVQSVRWVRLQDNAGEYGGVGTMRTSTHFTSEEEARPRREHVNLERTPRTQVVDGDDLTHPQPPGRLT